MKSIASSRTHTTSSRVGGVLLACAFLLSNIALGQTVSMAPGEYVYTEDQVTPLSEGWAQLYAAPPGATDWSPVSAPAVIEDGMFIITGPFTPPAVPPGSEIEVQVRAWRQADGSSYEEAQATGRPVGVSVTLTVTPETSFASSDKFVF